MNRKQNKQEITLMTLLANEATEDSRKLLKKYKKPDAKNCSDLEVKLSQLYFEIPDKLQIEKEFAEIHPHKNWLLKRTIVEKEITPPSIEVTQETSNVEGDCNNPNCPVHGKCIGFSNAEGVKPISNNPFDESARVVDLRNNQYAREHSMTLIAIIAISGIIFYALSNKNKS